MNERLKALADEAAKYAATTALPLGEAGDDLFLEKFSERIIQDCIECCVLVTQAALEKRDGASDAYSHGREDAAALCKATIRQNFGVGK